MWTITTVQDLLPPVRIRLGTQDYTGRITGRRLPYAMVSVGEIGYPFAWSTITRTLNTGRALVVPAASCREPAEHVCSPSHPEGEHDGRPRLPDERTRPL